jgi:beta-glucanase (GH16 family)
LRPVAKPSRRVLIVALSAVVAAAAIAVGVTLATQSSGVQWTKVWAGTFNGPAGAGVNQRYWKYDQGVGVFGTGEIETMTNIPGNVHLDGRGNLDITAVGQGTSWTSGRIQTVTSLSRKFAPPTGGEMMVSASLRQPDAAAGPGYWPAFWLLGLGSWPEHGEIDILENVNSLSAHSGTMHCGNLTQKNPDGTTGPCHEYTGFGSGLRPCATCQSAYHTYSAVIDRRSATDQQVRWYLDGHQFFSVSESRVGQAAWNSAMNHGYSIIFDLAIGGTFPNNQCHCTTPTSQTQSGGSMSVHSVAVYRTPAS